ncbi:MAG TPA: signal peptidase I [Longimicrobiales bacterium]|nr:signal peptidase I [Longimicrobiales bacterium]
MHNRDEQPGLVTQVLRADERARNILMGIWDWTRSILVAFALFVIVRTFVVEAFRIPTGSMENTLLVGDFLLVNKAVYGAEIPGTELRLPAFTEPRRGQVIVFTPPHEPAKNYVKRLVGVPGDTLEMRDKELYLDGKPVAEPYVRYSDRKGDAVHPDMAWQSNHLLASTSTGYHPTRDNWGPLVVPDGQYFMLGDNRDNSEDSRYWGFVPREAIHGRPLFVYYSFDTAVSGALPWLRDVRWGRIGEAIR